MPLRWRFSIVEVLRLSILRTVPERKVHSRIVIVNHQPCAACFSFWSGPPAANSYDPTSEAGDGMSGYAALRASKREDRSALKERDHAPELASYSAATPWGGIGRETRRTDCSSPSPGLWLPTGPGPRPALNLVWLNRTLCLCHRAAIARLKRVASPRSWWRAVGLVPFRPCPLFSCPTSHVGSRRFSSILSSS
jgi:hypothetical protein